MLATSVSTQAAASVTSAQQAFNGITIPSNCIGFTIVPIDGALWWGDSTLTSSNGKPLGGLQPLTILTSNPNAFYIMAQSGTVNVRRELIINTNWGALA